MNEIRKSPCAFCPYRRDVPSGIWHESEYRKLEAYDRPTGEQPMLVFGCHEKTGLICAGWAQCHGIELLALRLVSLKAPIEIPPITVPVFESGKAAAIHGLKHIAKPPSSAKRAMRYIQRRRVKTLAAG